MKENMSVFEQQELTPPGELEQNDEKLLDVPPRTLIASFWNRLFAFIIDGIIIAIPLVIIGYALREFVFLLGPWGRIIGYAVIIPYWGYFNSKARLGQTFGKRIMNIVVVDKNNQYLNLRKSFLRASVLGMISMLNGWSIPLIIENPIISILVTTIVLGGTLAMFYGLVFNRMTRQAIHDLLVGSYVIKAPRNLESVTPQSPLTHQRIMYGLVGVGLLIGIVGFFFQQNQAIPDITDGEWKEIQELHSALSDGNEFFDVSVDRVDRRSSMQSSAVLKDLNIKVWSKISCNRDPDYCEELIARIAQLAFEEYDGLENLSGMIITVENRFDLGLASGNAGYGLSLSMEDWQSRLENGFDNDNLWD